MLRGPVPALPPSPPPTPPASFLDFTPLPPLFLWVTPWVLQERGTSSEHSDADETTSACHGLGSMLPMVWPCYLWVFHPLSALAGDSCPALLMVSGWFSPQSFLGSLSWFFWVLISLSLPSSFHSWDDQAGMVCLEAPKWWNCWLQAPGRSLLTLCADSAVMVQGEGREVH